MQAGSQASGQWVKIFIEIRNLTSSAIGVQARYAALDRKAAMPARNPLVSGEIKFPENTPSFSGATVYVRLEETGRQDAPALPVAEAALQDVSYQAGGTARLEFALTGRITDPQGSYSVRVHVDLDGDGSISRGDYITMESYPVLTHGYPDRVTVRLRRV